MLEDHWRPPGFSVPNPVAYPVQFLWDSCFHAVIWAGLGSFDRAAAELRSMFAAQRPGGFVPHMTYHHDPDDAVDLWGWRGSSSLTQPPMYGHAVAEVVRRGGTVETDVVDAAERGLRWMVEQRRQPDGTIAALHPWETGMDDSPRWDFALAGVWTPRAWRQRKQQLLASVVVDGEGAAVDNPRFRVGSAALTALVAFNLDELGRATARRPLVDLGREVAGALGPLYDRCTGQWVDGWGSGASGSRRTLDGLLPVLCGNLPVPARRLLAPLLDRADMGGRHGPTFVGRHEPSFEPTTYWRGSVWAQMTYLAWLAARRAGADGVAAGLAAGLRRGARRSGFAEHWDPDSGQGFGAVPLSWSGLAALV